MSHARRMLNPLFSAEYRDKVLGYSPIAYWMLGEKSGSVAYDEVTDSGHADTGQSGDHVGVTLGQLGIGDGRTCPLYDGANDYTDVYTAALNGNFNGNEGSLHVWFKVSGAGVWTDGTSRYVCRLYVDANNQIQVNKAAGNNTITLTRIASGTSQSRADATISNVGWVPAGITWTDSGDEVKMYLSGTQLGATHNTVPTWAGNLNANSTIIGASWITPNNPWYGYIAHVSVFDRVLSAGGMGDLAAI